MRLWSLHPQYLDPKGLLALWREGLLAQAVLSGKTRGYRNHPQLRRFAATSDPCCQIGLYLKAVHEEATSRGYRFDGTKLPPLPEKEACPTLSVPHGQVEYEWAHLRAKLARRAPEWLARWPESTAPSLMLHPRFHLIEGGIAQWEVISATDSDKPSVNTPQAGEKRD